MTKNKSHRLVRSVLLATLGLCWLGLGPLVGWLVGDLADHLVLSEHHVVIYLGLGLSAIVLCAWAYGCRLIYLDVRAGLDEASNSEPTRRRSGYGWTAALAGPVVGLLVALSSASVAHSPARPAPVPAATAASSLSGPSRVHGGIRLEVPSAGFSAGRRTPGSAHKAPARDVELFGALSGLGLIGCALFARRLSRLRRLQQLRGRPDGRPPRLSDADAAIEAELRPLGLVELPDWIDAANRLLCAGLLADRALAAPRVSLVRAGRRGVELLVDEPVASAPAGFLLESDGRCLRLDPALSLAEVREGAGDAQPYLAVLIPVAEDDEASYLVACGPGESIAVRGDPEETERALGAAWAHLRSAPWGEVEFYRVGEASFAGAQQMLELSVEVVAGLAEATRRAPLWRAGLPEGQPVVLVADPHLGAEVREAAPGIVAVIGTMLEADRVLVYEGPMLSIEPLGITLPALLPTQAELAAVVRLSGAASACPLPSPEDDGPLPDPGSELPAAGAVEVRLLRPLPDLVGEIGGEKVAPEVVQLVAYLALHNYKATTEQLRDGLGRYHRDLSRSPRTVWNVVSHARSLLGPERFPPSAGGRPYLLDRSVSCDWLRLIETAAIGHSLERAGRYTEAIEALRQALELVSDEGPPCSDPSVLVRYSFLDAEQFHVELETVVVRAAHSMAMLAMTHRPTESSFMDAAFAISKGRVVAPQSEPLYEAALRLAAARDDEEGIESEFLAAVDAVDSLELGEEVDPRLEGLYNGLRHNGPSARVPGRAP